MTDLRNQLETKLADLLGVELSFYKDTDLKVVTYKKREIAHFHNGLRELDVRIPKKFAKRYGLGEPYVSPKHPDRSKNSIWRVLPYDSAQQVDEMVSLINLLLKEEY